MEKQELKEALTAALGHSIRLPITALLGRADEDGNKYITVDDNESDDVGKVYFRSIDDETFQGEAILENSGLKPSDLRYNMPVIVRRDDVSGQWVVSGRHARLAARFMQGVGDEQTAPVPAAALALGLLTQTDTPSMQAQLLSGIYTYNNNWKYKPDDTTQNFAVQAAALPADKSVFVLVQVEFDTLDLSYKTGTQVGRAVSFAVASAADAGAGTILPSPDVGCFRTGYVKLVKGMTSLIDNVTIFAAPELLDKAEVFNYERLVVTSFAYNTATPVSLVATDNAFVSCVRLIVDTPFDGGTTLKVGEAGSTARLMATTDNDPAVAGSYETVPDYQYTGNNTIVLSIANSGATVGAGRVLLFYKQ